MPTEEILASYPLGLDLPKIVIAAGLQDDPEIRAWLNRPDLTAQAQALQEA